MTGRGPAGGAASGSPGAGGAAAGAPRVDVLGVRINAIDMGDALATLERWIAAGERQYVCVVPAHTIMDCHDDPELRALVNASGMATPDGMSVVWLLHWLGYRDTRRVYGPDLVLAACERSLETGWRHYFLGGADGVAAEMAARLRERFPQVSVAGTMAPPFRDLAPAEDAQLCRSIDEARPDIVWVGLGSPKQERWMAAHRGSLSAPVLIGVGAAFDYLSGRRRQAPRWVQRSGLEWLYRLAAEPRRLWRRYRRYPAFALLASRQAFSSRSRPVEPE